MVVWALYLVYTAVRGVVVPPVPAAGMAGDVPRLGCGPGSHGAGQPSRAYGSLACAILAAVGAHNLYYASTHGAFPSGEGEHRYVSIAKMVEQATDPSAVIFTGQHSGPIRYYAGRTIIRFDLLDRAWLDRAVQWLNDRGRRPYFLLEEWEMTEFQDRFSASNALGTIALAPVVDYRAPGVPGRVYLFDPGDTRWRRSVITMPPPDAHAKCVRSVAFATLAMI